MDFYPEDVRIFIFWVIAYIKIFNQAKKWERVMY